MRKGWLTSLAVLAAWTPMTAWAQDDHGSVYTGDSFDDIRDADSRGPRQRQAISRKDFDDMVTRLFSAADTNRDGTIALTELQAIISARREVAIQERFTQIDTDRNKSLSYAEFSQWQRSLGSAVLSAADAGGGTGIIAEEIRPVPGRKSEEAIIARLIQPLSATVLTAANTNYDAGTSLAELIAYEGKRFGALDVNHDGFLTDDEVRAAGRGPAGARPGG